MPKQDAAAPAVATLRLTRPMLFGFTAGFMGLGGTVFGAAGYAVGLRATSVLATLFAMGASTGLLVLVLWFLAHAHEPDVGDAGGAVGEHR